MKMLIMRKMMMSEANKTNQKSFTKKGCHYWQPSLLHEGLLLIGNIECTHSNHFYCVGNKIKRST